MKKIKLITEKWQNFLASGEKLITEEPRSKSNWQQLTPSPLMDQPRDMSIRVKEQFPRPRIMGGANNDELVDQEGAYSFYRKTGRLADPTGSGNFYRVIWTPRDRSKNKIVATSKSSLLGNSAAAHVKKVIKCLGDLIINQVEGLPNRGSGSAKDPNIGKPPPTIAACQKMGSVKEIPQQPALQEQNPSKEKEIPKNRTNYIK